MLVDSRLSCRRACARLRALKTLKVLIKLVLRLHVLCCATGVRCRSRRDLIAYRLEVPGQRFKAHCRCWLQPCRVRSIVGLLRRAVATELRETIAGLQTRRFEFFDLLVLGRRRRPQLLVKVILIVLRREVGSVVGSQCLRNEILLLGALQLLLLLL